MKKITFALLAVLISSSAAAEWTRVGGGGDGSDVYVDLETLRRNGSKVKLWSLRNFKTLNGETKVKHLSNKIQWEMDCKEEQLRMPAYMEFGGRDGSGKSVAIQFLPNDSWAPIVPGSVAQMISEVGCDETIGRNKWTLVEALGHSGPNLNVHVYYDYSSTRKIGDRVSMWQMTDFRSKDHDLKGVNYSTKLHREYDCIAQQTRSIRGVMYPANMGVGKSYSSNYDDPPTPWVAMEAGTVGNDLWKIACDTIEGPS